MNSKSTDNSLWIIYTRTDHSVQSLPTLSIDSNEDTTVDSIQTVKSLVYENTERVIIEHLSMLKSESSVQTAIDLWNKHSEKNIFLMIVDMHRGRKNLYFNANREFYS